MHSEWCTMSKEAGAAIRAARGGRGDGGAGGRVFCVGTTSARTVESYAGAVEGMSDGRGESWPAAMSTKILITPGYRWRWTDGMLTNFHLPRSTLLAMVGALLSDQGTQGVQRLIARYREAIEKGYRFYSFGDAMLIL